MPICGNLTANLLGDCHWVEPTKSDLTYEVELVVKSIYYINTNEIPSGLSRENLITSQVKITCYLHM